METQNSDDAVIKAVETYSPDLLRAAFSVLRTAADAEDAVQEAFLILLKKRPVFQSEAHKKAWLIRVTINTAKNMAKQRRRSVPLEEWNGAFTYREETGVLNAVLSLPEKYRTVLHLYYYEGYDMKEIGGIMRLPAATVGTRLARGRALVKTALEAEAAAEKDTGFGKERLK